MKYTLCILFLVIFFSCNNNDYLIDGGVSSPYLEVSTYEFLTSNPLFDTLVLAINKAGLKAELEKEVTLFAVTSFSFADYIKLMTTRGRNIYNDPNYLYKFDSIPVEVLRDSLSMYIFPGKINRQDLTKEGKIYTNIIGTKLRISLEPQEIYVDQLKNFPEFVFLTYKQGTNWDDWDAKDLPTKEQDIKSRVQTSGLISTNGIIHVLPNTHPLFFYRN